MKEVFETTAINLQEENITKKSLLEKLEASLNEFTPCDTLHSVSLHAIVRVEEKSHQAAGR